MPEEAPDTQKYKLLKLERSLSRITENTGDDDLTLISNDDAGTLDEAVEATQQRVEVLKKSVVDGQANEDSCYLGIYRKAIQLIDESYDWWPKFWITAVADALCASDFPAVASKLVRRLTERGIDSSSGTEAFARRLYQSILKFTFKSEEVRQSFADSGIIPLLIAYLKDQRVVEIALENEKKQDFLKHILGICHNLARSPSLVREFNILDAQKVFHRFLSYSTPEKGDPYIDCVACLCTALVSNDKRLLDNRQSDTSLIDTLLDYTDKALNDERRKHRNISAEELAEGLGLLAIGDFCKQRLIGGKRSITAVILQKLLSNEAAAVEQIKGIFLASQLCFSEDGIYLVRKECMKRIEWLADEQGRVPEAVKKKAKVLADYIQNNSSQNEARPMSSLPRNSDRRPNSSQSRNAVAPMPLPVVEEPFSDVNSGHIFLSYSHQQKKLVQQVYNKLKGINGFNSLWIDNESMGNQLYSAMANGVKNSAAVVIFFSESYRQSDFCQIEGTLARRHRKPIIPVRVERDYDPADWLDAILAGNTWIDMYTYNDTTFQVLLRRIKEHTSSKTGEPTKTPRDNAPVVEEQKQKGCCTVL